RHLRSPRLRRGSNRELITRTRRWCGSLDSPARELWLQVPIPGFAGLITPLNLTTAAGTELTPTTITTGMTLSPTSVAQDAVTIRLSLASATAMAVTPLEP